MLEMLFKKHKHIFSKLKSRCRIKYEDLLHRCRRRNPIQQNIQHVQKKNAKLAGKFH